MHETTSGCLFEAKNIVINFILNLFDLFLALKLFYIILRQFDNQTFSTF